VIPLTRIDHTCMAASDRPSPVERRPKRGEVAAELAPMHDFIADWKRWSRTERVLAIVVTLLMVAVPLVLLAAGKAGI
jgi:hypothetical protein